MGALDLTPRDWTTGETVTAAMMNAEVRDKMNDAKARLSDTGWVNVSTSATFSIYASITPQVRKVGTLVSARWGWNNTGITASGTFNIGTIPAGYRPAQTTYFWFATSNNASIARGMVDSTGVVQVLSNTTVASYYLFPGGLSWYTD